MCGCAPCRPAARNSWRPTPRPRGPSDRSVSKRLTRRGGPAAADLLPPRESAVDQEAIDGASGPPRRRRTWTNRTWKTPPIVSAERPECYASESANAPRAIGAEQKRFQREAFGRDTLAGLGGLSNGIRDGVLFRRELGVGQCPSDGVRVVHTDIVLRRPRCRTADRVTCPPGRTKLGPAWCSRDTELTLRRSRRRRLDSFNGSTRPVARRHSRRGMRRHRGLKRTSPESGRYLDQDRDSGLVR